VRLHTLPYGERQVVPARQQQALHLGAARARQEHLQARAPCGHRKYDPVPVAPNITPQREDGSSKRCVGCMTH
jgi:hypothetical protein